VAPPAPNPPRPFPEGAKIAFVNIQRIASESAEGRASTARVAALSQKKSAELGDKNKQLAANQQKLQQSGAVLSDAARAQLEKDVERLQVEIQRAQQDAQTEIQDLQQELQAEFQKKLLPIIQQVVTERSLQMLFSQADAGIIWADGGLDLTADIIKRFDTATAAPAAAPPAAPPPTAAPTPAPAAPKPPTPRPPAQ
jgi:Skp family chaperone for outer membrane proteins